MNLLKKIYKQIKKYNTIVIARHIGPDPDALGSTLGLKEIILSTFPNKKVYVVGNPTVKHAYIGSLDKFEEELYNNSLLLVLDTPDLKRVDGVDPNRFEYKIKIDHHPFIEKFCDLELIDDKSSSASQLIIELVKNTNLKLNKEAASKLFIGIVGDTNRFMFSYTTDKTFDLVSYMIKETNLDFTKLYSLIYSRSIDDLKLQGYVVNNMIITDNNLGYLKVTSDELTELKTDAASVTNVVNSLQNIEELLVWVICVEDSINNNIRTSIRSRGPIINEIASHYSGGGHSMASGARPKDFEEADKLIEELDNKCREYKEVENEE